MLRRSVFSNRGWRQPESEIFLSEYLFSMVASNRNYVLSGRVVCLVEEDYELLKEFVCEQAE